MNVQAFWPDASGSTLTVFGGERSFELPNDPPQQPVWSFKSDGNGGGDWVSSPGSTAYNNIAQAAGSCFTSGNGIGLSLGGHLNDHTYPKGATQSTPVTGLVQYNMTTGTWEILDATGYNANQTCHFGMTHWVPGLSSQGLAFFIGGQISAPDVWTSAEPLTPMSDIAIYDPATQKWYHQTATGDIPEPRTGACMTGTQGTNGTYEM
jgi:hypothetical protein